MPSKLLSLECSIPFFLQLYIQNTTSAKKKKKINSRGDARMGRGKNSPKLFQVDVQAISTVIYPHG